MHHRTARQFIHLHGSKVSNIYNNFMKHIKDNFLKKPLLLKRSLSDLLQEVSNKTQGEKQNHCHKLHI